MRHAIRLLALAAIAYAMACGGDFAGADSCSFSLVITPELPVRGDIVEAAVNVDIVGDVSGIEEVYWGIQFDGAPVSYDVTGANGDEVVFTAGPTGVYNIAVSGSLGGTSCSGDYRDLNVSEPGAVLAPMRLVVVPRANSVVPPQTLDFQLPGGADFTLSTLSLDGGTNTPLYVYGPSEPLEGAYVRAMPSVGNDSALWLERFSQEGGTVNLHLANIAYDLLVVPDDDLPAVFLADQQALDLSGISIGADAGVGVTGTVADPAGDPIAGAQVQVTVAGAPSTIGTTNASGAFALKARPGGPVSVIVTPPASSGLPQLERDNAPDIAAGSELAVRYAAALEVRTVNPVLRESDNSTPAAGARVTFSMHPNDAAGAIAVDGDSAAATGSLVRNAQANGSGVIGDQALTSAVYDVIVEPGPSAPAGERVRFAPLNLSSGQGAPASLRLAAPGHLTGLVLDDGDAPVAGAQLIATPLGSLARATTAGASTTTDESGAFDLALAAGGSYQIRIDGPLGRGRMLRFEDAPAAPGGTVALNNSVLPATLRLTGALTVPGGGAVTGAVLQLQCLLCGPDNGAMTVAEAVSDSSGEFLLYSPDPGVVAQ